MHSIVAGFFVVFNYFGGGGMCEAAYKGALEHELTLRGHTVHREVSVPVYYKGKLVARQRLDMGIDDKVIVECKATERFAPSAGPQLLGYLRASIFQVGVLLHFGSHPEFYRFVDSRKGHRDRDRPRDMADPSLDDGRPDSINSRDSRPQQL